MWGTWLIATLSGTVGVVLIVFAFAFGGWPVLVALGVAAMIGAVLLASAGWRRGGEYVERADESEAPSAPQSDPARSATGRPRSGGAPASGEGR
jgi:hypothetical protein